MTLFIYYLNEKVLENIKRKINKTRITYKKIINIQTHTPF